jgi:trehalose 6-phosphate phosphatase
MLMERLHSQMEEVARELACAPRLLLGLDFDGTLAPIVSDPVVARISDETGQILDALAARPGTTVAVISGRAMADLLTRITQNVILGGNHGLEMLANGILWRHPRAAELEDLLRTISRQLAVETRGIPGARVEYKGLTASIHYRNVEDHQVPGLLEKVRVALAPYDDCFFLTKGSKVVEVRPAVAWNKGSAMLRIIESMRRQNESEIAVCYIGDDATDESVFHTLTDAVTVRVCQDCRTAARFTVQDTDQVQDFLSRIVRG